MTTRRSRLKAVANLPVRRKLAVFQETSDIVPSTEKYLAVESFPSDRVEVKVSTKTSLEHLQSDTPLSPFSKHSNSNSNSDNDNDNNNEKISNTLMSNSATDKVNLTESTNSNDVECEKSNIVNEISCSNRSQSSKYKRKVKPNLMSSRPKENSMNKVLKGTDDSVMPIIETFVSTESVNHNDLKGNKSSKSGHQDALTSIDGELSSLTSNPCLSVITVTSLDQGCEFQNSGQIEAKDFWNNIPSLVCSKAENPSEIGVDREVSEPVLTTLVNCGTGVSSSLSTVSNGQGTESVLASDDTPEFCINNTCTNAAVIEIINYPDNDGIARNIISPIGDKGLLENLMYQERQEIISLDNCNVQPKALSQRNVTTAKRKRTKCSDFTRKLADARREFQKKYEKTKPDRSTLKMIDLIFYNPTTNPMESKNKSDKKEELLQNRETPLDIEEDIDEPQSIDFDSNLQCSDVNGTYQRMPVPQVKIGSNGEIILDEKSVVIETTEAKKGREDLLKNSIPIFEDRGSKINYYRGKTRKTRDWTDFETKRFYKALNTIGPDFSLMQKYFPKRSRMELKNKFKREERLNRSLIDKALINPSEFDMTQLEKDLAVEKKAEEEEQVLKSNRGSKEKSAMKRSRTKSSLFSREILSCNETGENQILTNVLSDRKLFKNENDKKEKEIGHILRKYLLREMKNEKTEIPIAETNYKNASNHGVT